ncbi:gle1 RNA export mediator [Xylocopa sonorina]|uniref:gle1 RNA export mediator n=1 Tax=Xylocopa sonorina TaxID=1818115 RepID=UPI00403A808A
MDDVAPDFVCLKISALKKVSRISFGSDLTVNKNQCKKSENIENEQNSCNITVPQKSISSQNSESLQRNDVMFSVKKILSESECQRKEEVQKQIERHWQNMQESEKFIQENIKKNCSEMAEERERRSKKNYADMLEKVGSAEKEEIHRRHEQQQKDEERRKKEKELTKKIMNLRDVYGTKYRDFIVFFENCKDKDSITTILSAYTAKLEELDYQMNIIDEKIKTGEVTPNDLNIIETMVHHIDEMLCMFKSEIDRINAQRKVSLAETESTMQSHIRVEEPQRQELTCNQPVSETIQFSEHTVTNDAQNNQNDTEKNEEKREDVQTENITFSNIPQITSPTINTNQSVSTTESDKDHLYEYVDKESLQIYMNSQKFLKHYVQTFDEFLQSPVTKMFRFECQKAINIPVNAISGINEQHLRDKYERLHNLLAGKCWSNANQNLHGAAFCKNILAKKIVSQGETLVSSKPKMAFPIAAVTVALWNDHADFGDLLLAYFHTMCPYTVPVFLPQMVGQSNEDYYKLMGYKYTDDGTVEKHDKFLKRMSGLMRLYASITITPQRKGITKANPHGLQNAWRWLAAILNIEPRKEISDLCATFLLDMLEVTGNAMQIAYPKQFHKLLILLSEQYYPRMQNVGSIGGGPLVRLEEFLRNSLAKSSIPPPDGLLPPKFW